MTSTANPRHPNNPPTDPKAEPTGLVTKDSLANESIEAGGAFGENKNPEVLGVKGGQSTLANTDTSNAETIPAAASKSQREPEDESTQYPDAAAGKGFSGTTSDQGYRGGPTGGASVIARDDSGAVDTSGNTSVRPYVDQAPNYAADNASESKPKGKNLVEGGDIPPNRSTFVGAVDGPNDPGRLAELKFAKDAADASGGTGARDYGEPGKNQENVFDNLNPSERT